MLLRAKCQRPRYRGYCVVAPAVATCDHLRIIILDRAAARQLEPPPKSVADSDREGKSSDP
jgi:hypothetical protein